MIPVSWVCSFPLDGRACPGSPGGVVVTDPQHCRGLPIRQVTENGGRVLRWSGMPLPSQRCRGCPMADPPIPSLRLWAFEWRSAVRLAQRNDPFATQALRTLWEPYQPCCCGGCRKPIAGQPGTMIIPDYSDRNRLIAVPLCSKCQAEPFAVRQNKCISNVLFSNGKRPINVDMMPKRTRLRRP